MKTMHIPMISKVFGVQGSRGKQISKCGDSIPPRLPRTPKTWKPIGICRVFIDLNEQNMENHWDMYGFRFCLMEEPRNALEHLRVSIREQIKQIDFNGFAGLFVKQKRTPYILQCFHFFSFKNNEHHTYSNGFPGF